MAWHKVFEDRIEVRTEIVKGILLEQSIGAVVVPKKDSSYQFGHFEVHVQSEDVLRAIKIIEEEISFE